MRWKKANYKKIISYITNKTWETEKSSFTEYHNIKNPNNALKEFYANEKYRKKRKNGVALYHEILSFHHLDSKKLTLPKLNDIASKYISIRASNALCLASPHFDKGNVHIHFCFSGTEYKSSKTIRMNNYTFKNILLEIEDYQKSKYPELNNSIVYGKNIDLSKKKNAEKEFQLKKRLLVKKKKTDKIQLTEEVNFIFLESSNKADFLNKLTEKGFEIYYYRKKATGILFNQRKYRFSALGLGKSKFTLLEQRKDEIKAISQNRRKQKGMNRTLYN